MLVNVVRRFGAAALFGISRVGRMGTFLCQTLACVATPPLKGRHLVKQIHFIGWKSVFVVCLTGLFTGMVLALQGYNALKGFGSEAFLGPMVVLSLVRELGPVLSALMVTGRAGSAITAHIGIMRINEQIDALELLGLNPLRYLSVPNLLAALITLPLLGAIFNAIGVFGAYVVAVKLLGMASGTFFGEMSDHLRMQDLWSGAIKSVSFGAIMAWVCCHKGYYSSHGAEGVSTATTGAVVTASVLILVWDYLMTAVLF
ncbi:MAG: MlaE family lipid ABC transporter permease subunit [Verrucomicrobia bacterium]|nr:MlaE family lipid ABC transporter permease subunit [Verrucomicrobiota bacterium]